MRRGGTEIGAILATVVFSAQARSDAEGNATSEPVVIAKSRALLAANDTRALGELIADDACFLSPVVHTPQRGKALTVAYLTAALRVLGNRSFVIRNEWIGATSAVLEFEVTVDGIIINGVDMIAWNSDDKITEFKVMMRPLKAINLLHQRMAATLEEMQRAS